MTSRRDLDAPERGWRDTRSKTGMLEMTPMVVFKAVDPEKRGRMHQKSPTYVEMHEHMQKTPEKYVKNQAKKQKERKRARVAQKMRIEPTKAFQ